MKPETISGMYIVAVVLLVAGLAWRTSPAFCQAPACPTPVAKTPPPVETQPPIIITQASPTEAPTVVVSIEAPTAVITPDPAPSDVPDNQPPTNDTKDRGHPNQTPAVLPETGLIDAMNVPQLLGLGAVLMIVFAAARWLRGRS